MNFSDNRLYILRTLFSREEIGIVDFEKERSATREKIQNTSDLNAYKEFVPTKFPTLKLDEKRDELKTFLMAIDGDSNELKTLKTMMRDYNIEYNSKVHSVSPYCFGTPIMRLFYIIDSPDLALEFMGDSDFRGVFEQQQTYKILLNLLYKHGRYADIHEYYERHRTNLASFESRPDKTLDCLVFAACYHLVRWSFELLSK